MGGKRVQIRSATAIAILIPILAWSCSAAVYRISSDELIEDDDSPVTAEPEWRWSSQEQTPSRSQTNVFPNRVPSWASEPPNEFPESWKMALRRAAFQTLRHEAALLLGYPGTTSSVQGNVYRELWYRLSVAEFVGMNEYQDYDEEELQSDISTLAEGLLIHKNGDLKFYITHRKSSCACEGAKTLATWSIRRLRHSGPGRGRPQYQLRFSVIPKSEDQAIDLVSVQVESVRPTSPPSYRGIPIFTRNHHKEYNPQFITEYAEVISSYLRHRDSIVKHHPDQENKNRGGDRNRDDIQNRGDLRNRGHNQNRERYSEYESVETPPEEYTESYSDTYTKYDPKQEEEEDEEDSEEYDTQYGGQETSRRQYHQYYKQQYSSYQTPQVTTERYQHHQDYRERPTPYKFYKSPTVTKEFRPSPQFQRYSESDPLFADNQRVDQKVLPQVIVAKHEKISTVYQITEKPVQNIPTINFYQEFQQEEIKGHRLEDNLYKSVKRNNQSSEFYHADWSKRAISAKPKVKENKENPAQVLTSSQEFAEGNSENAHSKGESFQNLEALEDSSNIFPIGSKSLATLVSVVEAQHENFNSKRSISRNQNPTKESSITTSISNSGNATASTN